jgi:hypothetical protein
MQAYHPAAALGEGPKGPADDPADSGQDGPVGGQVSAGSAVGSATGPVSWAGSPRLRLTRWKALVVQVQHFELSDPAG